MARRSAQEMRVWSYDVETGDELMILSRARVIKADHGGVLFGGVELHFRGWCVPMAKVVVPLASGKSVNDPVPETTQDVGEQTGEQIANGTT